MTPDAIQAAPFFARRLKRGIYRIVDGLVERRCPRCREYLPCDREFFYKTSSEADGFYRWCKACYLEWRGKRRYA